MVRLNLTGKKKTIYYSFVIAVFTEINKQVNSITSSGRLRFLTDKMSAETNQSWAIVYWTGTCVKYIWIFNEIL